MGLFDELREYIDGFGYVHNVKGAVSQNGLTFTPEALLAAKLTGEPIGDGPFCWLPLWCLDQQEKLLYRHPEKHREGNQMSIDCVVGFALLCKLSGARVLCATLLRLWGEKKWRFFGFFRPNYYNPDETQYRTKYSHRAHFIKYPAAIAALEYVDGRRPPFWRRLYFGLAIRYGSVGTHDNARLSLIQAACHPDEYWLNFAITRVKRRWGSLEKLYEGYWGAEHPITRAYAKRGI